MNRLLAIAVLALVLSATSAQAGVIYFSGNLGASILEMDVESSTFPTIDIDFKTGLTIGGALGFGFGNFRVEGEVAYRGGDIDDISFPGSNNAQGDGYALSLMGNGYYDFRFGKSPWVPYLGAGIGLAIIDIDATSNVLTISGSELGFALQFMAGMAYEITPQTAITLGYKLFIGASGSGEDPPPNADFSALSNEFTLGLRYTF